MVDHRASPGPADGAGIAHSRRGSVMVMFALFLTALAGATSFALDLSNLYLVRQERQMVSDLAVLGATSTAAPIAGSVPSATALATARAIVAANGLDAGATTLTVTQSPARSGARALKATIGTTVTLPIGLLSLGARPTVNVASWAEPSGTGACFRSQSGPTNIYNNAIVTAPACTAEAKTFFYSCGKSETVLATVATGYTPLSEAPYLCPTASLQPNAAGFDYSATVTDTIAGTAPVTGMLAHLKAMAGGWSYGTLSPVRPSTPPGTSQSYSGQSATIAANARLGSLAVANSSLSFQGGGADPRCTAPTTIAATLSFSGSNTLTFGSGCYVFGAAVNATAGSTSRLEVAPGASVVFVFAGGTLTVASGATLTFGDATVYVNGGSIANYGTRLSFGNGPFYLWGGTIYNVLATSTLTFGNGPFYFYGGSVSNTGTMTLGNGPFDFQGGSLALNPRSTTSFGVGDMSFYGGTVIAGGASVTFGAGGSAETGSGTVAMYGGSFALTADSLTAIGTSFGFKGGTLSLLGIGTIEATAPTDPHPTLGYRNLLFAVWGGAFNLYQSGGQMDTMSGLVYAPATNASIYGSQTITPPPGGCFGVVSGVLDIYQNARINASPCAGLTGNTAGRAVLVQ